MSEMVRILRLDELGLEQAVKLLRPEWPFSEEVEKAAANIVQGVVARGDQAILEYEQQFDDVSMSPEELRIPPEEFEMARAQISREELRALRFLHERIRAVEKDLLRRVKRCLSLPGGGSMKTTVRPIGSVGCYVPGGKAVYPTSLIMALTPAEVAGVRRRLVCTPPTKGKRVAPSILVAAEICGADEVYMVGGAQAIAAMAYGTATIPAVEKIVGPGGVYATAAKMLVSKRVGVDFPAGPTELLVLADANADPPSIALDLVSQAEHSEDCTCGLVTDSEALAFDVIENLKSLLQSAPRKKIASTALVEKGFVLVCRSLDEGARFVGAFAPEHVEIMTSGATDLAENIDSAGLILIGEDSPVAATDYAVGSNHILPTGGYARLYSGLSSLDFVKVVNVVKCSKNSLRRIAGTVRTLSSLEGLPNHWLAVQRRLAR